MPFNCGNELRESGSVVMLEYANPLNTTQIGFFILTNQHNSFRKTILMRLQFDCMLQIANYIIQRILPPFLGSYQFGLIMP